MLVGEAAQSGPVGGEVLARGARQFFARAEDGAIGVVMGYEISQAFDDQGSRHKNIDELKPGQRFFVSYSATPTRAGIGPAPWQPTGQRHRGGSQHDRGRFGDIRWSD